MYLQKLFFYSRFSQFFLGDRNMFHNPTRYYSRFEKLVAALIAQGRGVGLKQLVADNSNKTMDYIFSFPAHTPLLNMFNHPTKTTQVRIFRFSVLTRIFLDFTKFSAALVIAPTRYSHDLPRHF